MGRATRDGFRCDVCRAWSDHLLAPMPGAGVVCRLFALRELRAGATITDPGQRSQSPMLSAAQIVVENSRPGDGLVFAHPQGSRGWLQMCYGCSMSVVASRELRNDTAGVLRRVQAGEEVTITVNGHPVAVIAAVRPRRRRWLTKAELVQRLQASQADAGLREDLAELAGETTDDL